MTSVGKVPNPFTNMLHHGCDQRGLTDGKACNECIGRLRRIKKSIGLNLCARYMPRAYMGESVVKLLSISASKHICR